MLAGVRRVALTGVCLTAALMASAMAADASIPHDAVVSDQPANVTPHAQDGAGVTNAAVYAFNQVGNTMYAGGTFHQVADAGRTATFTRLNLFAFDANSGALSGFAPNIDGPVWALASNGSSLYVGGQFNTVNGVARKGLVKMDAATGAVDQTFNAALPSGHVTEIRLVKGRLIVSGTFPKRLAALDPGTGKDTGYINVPITGQVANKDGRINSGPTEVYKFAVTPDGSRLVAIGNFTTVANQARSRAFMLDLGTASASLSSWYYAPLQHACRASSLPDQLRDVDFAPDGSYFVMVATGWVPADPYRVDKNGTPLNTDICDVAARFETNIAAPQKPTWTNYTGGDTLHSVAVTGAAVYVQGHQRWLDNPYGVDRKESGGVDRPGIGAIDSNTGKALAWNPTKTRGVGGKDLYATPAGLWIGSDTKSFNNRYHDSIAFCALS